MKKTSLFIFTLFFSCIVSAASIYKIELIAFSFPNKSKAPDNATNISLLNTSSAVKLTGQDDPSSDPNGYYKLLPNSSFTMSKQATAISNKSGYTILAHIAWLQPIGSSTNSSPIFISGGNLLSNSHYQLEGSLRFYKTRFITMKTNLDYTQPNWYQQDDTSTYFQAFNMKQTARMRSKEIHYLDSPYIGLLVKVMPYKAQNTPNAMS